MSARPREDHSAAPESVDSEGPHFVHRIVPLELASDDGKPVDAAAPIFISERKLRMFTQMRESALSEWHERRLALAEAWNDLPNRLEKIKRITHDLLALVKTLGPDAWGDGTPCENLLHDHAVHFVSWVDQAVEELRGETPNQQALLLDLDNSRTQLLRGLALREETEDWMPLVRAPGAAPDHAMAVEPPPRRVRPPVQLDRKYSGLPLPVSRTESPLGTPQRQSLTRYWETELRKDLDGMEAAARRQDWLRVATLAHKIKGGTGTFGWGEMAELCHRIEDVTIAVKENRLPVPALVADLCGRLRDAVVDACDNHDARAISKCVEATEEADLMLRGAAGSEAGKSPAAAAPGVNVSANPPTALPPAAAEPALLPMAPEDDHEEPTARATDAEGLYVDAITVDDVLAKLDAALLGRTKIANAAVTIARGMSEMTRQSAVLRNVIDALRTIASQGEGPVVATPGLTDWFHLQPITSLEEAAGRLEEVLANISTHSEDSNAALDLTNAASAGLLDTLTQAHQRVGSMRLEPLSDVLDEARRTVQHAARQSGRQVRIVTRGGDLRVEAGVRQELLACLRYLCSNAVAHGIESAPERQANGKAHFGTIVIEALSETNVDPGAPQRIAVCVRDDGRGIDREAVKAKARRIGYPEPAKWTMDHILELLLRKGFSTREAADGVAGRGEGLHDCFLRVQALGGRLDVATKEGHHTEWTMSVPVSVSSMDLMTVVVDGQEYGVPTQYVQRVVSVEAGSLIAHGGPSDAPLSWRDDKTNGLVTVLDLPEFFGFRAVAQRAGLHQSLLLDVGGRPLLLLVDSVGKVRPSLLRVLDPLALNPQHPYWSAVTAASDGGALLVLDLAALCKNFLTSERVPRLSQVRSHSRPLVLVVDDSVAIRNAASKFLRELGFEVTTAEDGRKAIDIFSQASPGSFSAVLTDLEMAPMNGYQVIEGIRRLDPEVFIAVITSRNNDEQRRNTRMAGANDFLAKPITKDSIAFLLSRFIQSPPTRP